MEYASVEQRMAHTYLDLFPPFVPDEQAPVSIAEQERFHTLLRDLYLLAYDEPSLFVPQLHADDAHPNRFNKASYGKPDLMLQMRAFMKAVDRVLQRMFDQGRHAPVRYTTREKQILSRVGVQPGEEPSDVWQWMATRTGSNVTSFSHAFFKAGYPYTRDILPRLLGPEQTFLRLENWMLERGYQRVERTDGSGSGYALSLTYVNPAWSTDAPGEHFMYKVRHTGVSIQYDPYVEHPAVLGLRIPQGMKPWLEVFQQMSPALQSFILRHTKVCDACGYCVQTDKTGSRPLAFVTVEYGHDEKHLCPYFPGYRFCWTNLDDILADSLVAFLGFLDSFAPCGR